MNVFYKNSTLLKISKEKDKTINIKSKKRYIRSAILLEYSWILLRA